ncbi:MAG: hypothetical protein J0H36_04230, partial [Hyphomicrobium denitrificans]|nr:hypothetical protein [Hyphomicrobium denitrificans]
MSVNAGDLDAALIAAPSHGTRSLALALEREREQFFLWSPVCFGAGIAAHTPGVARWWTTLGDAQLTALIDDAIAHSPDIRAAQAKVRQSRASLRNHQADLLPKAGVDLATLRTRSPDLSLLGGNGGSGSGRGPLDLYVAGFDAS